jgi:transposase
LSGHQISQARFVSASESCHLRFEGVEAGIKRALMAAEVIHVDEIGSYAQGKRNWLHVASTQVLTFYAAHTKRGKQALDDLEILPRYQGVLVHDAYASYRGYPCQHSLCNAHLLHELEFFSERHKQAWAKDMAELLHEVSSYGQAGRSDLGSSNSG